MAYLYLDICLSDIPKDRIKESANGKKYLKAIIRPRKDADRDGYDHYIAVSVPRDEQGDRPLFIGRAQEKKYEEDGRGKTFSGFKGTDNKPGQSEPQDLPF